MDGKTLIFPQVSHDIHLLANLLTSSLPNVAQILLKAVLKRHGEQRTQCSLTLHMWQKQYINIVKPKKMQRNIKQKLGQPNVTHILHSESGDRTHYIFQHQSIRRTWLEALGFCANMDTESLVYLSPKEVKEIWITFKGIAGIVFTGYHYQSTQQVRVSIHNPCMHFHLYIITFRKGKTFTSEPCL